MPDGRVEAFNEGTGKGSRFVVTLPVLSDLGLGRDENSGKLHTAPQTQGSRLTILVVDDNADAADMLADLLRIQGHVVRVEYSSTAALAVAQENPQDLYILDIGLPISMATSS